MMSKSASDLNFGSFNDLKRRTESFGSVTTDGVNKGTTYAHHISSIKTAPKFSMGVKEKHPSFLRSNSVPAPGTYNFKDESRNPKHTFEPKYSFGGESRWGAAVDPKRRKPGPGAYNPRNPILAIAPKIGFGSSMRLKGAIIAQPNPGPGAYESRTSLGEGLCFTAKGRHATHYVAQKSLPGPGAYDPVTTSSTKQGPKAGFGTSRRSDIALRALGPGPGSYDLQNFKTTGTDAPKSSMTSRRRVLDINSYLTPGPGSYNSHATCFGGD
jgi:hypothetical protein